MMIEAIRAAATPLLAALPEAAWLPHALIRKPDGKLDKPPCEGANTKHPETWFTIDRALELLASRNNVAGIGFAITAGIIGLDYDDCRDPTTGELTPEVQQELERFNSYAYVTPSGKGIRIVGTNDKGHPIPGGKRVCYLPNSQRVEIFVGPTNFYNTFTADVIPGYDTLRDISDDTLDYLQSLPGRRADDTSKPLTSNQEPTRSIEAIQAALRVIPNANQNWDEWCRIGMAAWRSSGGSQDGLDAWMEWSGKHPCHEAGACEDRWKHWFISPPTKIGFGTLYHEARQANPLFVAPFDNAIQYATTPDGTAYDPETGEVLATPAKPDMSGQRPDKPKRPAILSLSELDALPPPEWLIENLIPDTGLVVPYGPPKSGKTFIILSAGLHIAAGRDWFGMPVKQGAVVYIAGEGVGGLSLRLRAMRSLYQIDASVPFWIIPRAVNFRVTAEVVALADLIRNTVGDIPVALVVVDTLARAMPGADENSAQEVGLVVAGCDWLRDELQCTIAPIHHSGKDEGKGARGTSALRGAWDAAFKITSQGKTVTMTVEDQKEGESGQVLTFQMEQVPVGIGRTSLVPVLMQPMDVDSETGGQGGTFVPSGLTGLALTTLFDLLAGPEGALVPPYPDVPVGVRGVRVDAYRKAFYDRIPTRTADAKKKAFSRSVDILQERRLIGMKDPWIWSAK